MADTAVARLRGILARDMTANAIDQLLGDVFAEQLGTCTIKPAEPAPVPPWTDVSTWNYQARMCTACGWETRWDVARAMERHIATEHPPTTAETARCCMCGSADVRYRNYLEQPFCWPCADGTSPEGKAAVAASLADDAPVPERWGWYCWREHSDDALGRWYYFDDHDQADAAFVQHLAEHHGEVVTRA